MENLYFFQKLAIAPVSYENENESRSETFAMANAKWTNSLEVAARNSGPDDVLHVVVELPTQQADALLAHSSRSDAIQAIQRNFHQLADPLKLKIEQLGGELLDEAWINSTLSIKLPVAALGTLSREDSVETIDLPRSVHVER